jgi:hypothetical protein
MGINLPADLEKRLEQEETERGQRKLDSLRTIGLAVDDAGLYERVLSLGLE